MSQGFGGIEQKSDHEHGQDEWIYVRGYVQGFAVEKYQSRAGPNQSENGGQLHDVLFGEMVSGIQLENQHVIDAGWTPAVDVDAHQEQKYDQQQRAPVQPNHDPPVRVFVTVSNAFGQF